MTTTATACRPRRKTVPPPTGRDELVAALDYLAGAIRVTGNRKLLPIYERLERELEAMDDSDAIMRRVLKRTKRGKR